LELLQNQNLKIGLITNACYAEDIDSFYKYSSRKKYFQSVIFLQRQDRKPRQEIFDLAFYSLASSPVQKCDGRRFLHG
jgi:FMN phosphatase YigB (HAD superfamily)